MKSIILLIIFYTNSVSAHPGRTASDGCHYCRTNCDDWGVAQDKRHCHQGYSSHPNPSPDKPDSFYRFVPLLNLLD